MGDSDKYVVFCEKKKIQFPPQHQPCQPGIEAVMVPRPISEDPNYIGTNKLLNKVAIITGGDSGIGRAITYAFAKEGADVVVVFYNEYVDAEETKARVEQIGRRCILMPGDIKSDEFCKNVVNKTVGIFGHIDILVNNAGVQFPQKSIRNISNEQLELTFRTNIFPLFYMTKAALPFMPKGSTIINTASITAYKGFAELIDYSSTKGAIVSFTRSLALSLVDKCIRVNAVAPGAVWTPLIPSSFSLEDVEFFGNKKPNYAPMERSGQPFELAPAYVYLASNDSSYVTGTVLHVNGGAMVTT